MLILHRKHLFLGIIKKTWRLCAACPDVLGQDGGFYFPVWERYVNGQTKRILRVFSPWTNGSPLSSTAGFSAFYERTHLSLFRYLYGLTGGPQEEVEDLAAEAFTRAWRSRRSFDGDGPAALGWLMKIGRRLVIDSYRRRKARPLMDDPIDDEVPEAAAPLEDTVQLDVDQETLLALLQRLPETPREIVVLRYLLGWPVNQIAAYQDTSENNISAALHRAILRLRRQWPGEEK